MKTLEEDIKKRIEEELEPLTEGDIEQMLDEILDRDGEINIGNLTYYPSDVVKQIDPVAYRQSYLDVYDMLSEDGEYTEINEELYYTEDVEQIITEEEAKEE